MTAATAPIISAIVATRSSKLGTVVAGPNGGIGDIGIELSFFEMWYLCVLVVISC